MGESRRFQTFRLVLLNDKVRLNVLLTRRFKLLIC